MLPFFGWVQWIVNDIGVQVKSKASREKSIQDCIRAVKAGNSIVIYPEGNFIININIFLISLIFFLNHSFSGTRSQDPLNILDFRLGAFTIAQECGVQVPSSSLSSLSSLSLLLSFSSILPFHPIDPACLSSWDTQCDWFWI